MKSHIKLFVIANALLSCICIATIARNNSKADVTFVSKEHNAQLSKKYKKAFYLITASGMIKAKIFDKKQTVKCDGLILITLNGKEIGLPFVNQAGKKLKWTGEEEK